MRLAFFFLILSLSTFAQHASQPVKESSADLRSGIVMFSIEDVSEEKVYWLERTPNLDYFLRMKEEDDEQIRKVDTRDARKLEMDFASRFLKCQYELPPSPEECKVTLRLSMKGEQQNICKKEDKKTQEIVPFYKELAKRF